jgi:hypothetical protein
LNELAQTSDASAEQFGQQVYARLVRFMYVLAVVAAPVAWIVYGWAFALFYVIGCAVSLLNFYWLKRTLEALVDRTISSGRKPSSAGVIARLLLRYVLIAVAAYVIFNSSAMSAYGLFVGLSLPVGAIMMEAAHQASRELWRRL